ncbi:c-type cytochrome [Breoghania sp.]|uniref:c-type cytochrome n=1 Tax=Breoghania sp. TaxID=2065378 RepID=UPI002AAB47D9|nr:c-type cytochrome [Breoghania sp.]
MRQRGRLAALACVLAVIGSAGIAAEPSRPGDAERGKAVFSACKGCHQVGADARNGIGPHLDGLFGRVAGSLDGFSYSSALRRHGADGLAWGRDSLGTYLRDPQVMIPGTRMSFRGMEDAAARADLIAYLEKITASAPASDPAPVEEHRAEIGSAAMGLVGDRAYGEYLASECLTCHQQSGRTDGIPSIVGWPREAFIRVIFEYKTNVRRHQVMQLMTANLGNEEIAALAAYFGGLDPQ